MHQNRKVEFAKSWWEFFGFELLHPIEDAEKKDPLHPAYFGAVFGRRTPVDGSSSSNHSTAASATNCDSAPSIVIATRGTVSDHDLGLITSSLLSLLETRNCFKIMLTTVQRYLDHDVNCNGGRGLWLCGHSLGATICTAVGQAIARSSGVSLTTFLFNPPYDLDPTTKNQFWEDAVEAARILRVGTEVGGPVGFVAVGLGIALTRGVKKKVEVAKKEKEAKMMFERMSDWTPRLYVNPHDLLCSRYIKCFNDRRPRSGTTKLPKHIASAVLVCTTGIATVLEEDHSLRQWWCKDLLVKTTKYRCGNEPRVLNAE